MNFAKLAAAALISVAALPALAHAQEAAKPKLVQGATVYGPQGGVVGTIEKITGETVVVNTGEHTATLQSSVFGSTEKGIAIGFTQAQLNQAVAAANQAANAKVAAALVPGAALRSMDGLPVGTIKSIGADGAVLIERESGSFSLQRNLFGTDANGLIVRLTAPQIEEALAQAKADAADPVAETEAEG